MKKFYSIYPEFYEMLRMHKAILPALAMLDKEQKDLIIEPITLEDMLYSSLSYFKQDIFEEKGSLFYEQFHLSIVHKIECINGQIMINDEGNPFYALLKRKYPFFIVEDLN